MNNVISMLDYLHSKKNEAYDNLIDMQNKLIKEFAALRQDTSELKESMNGRDIKRRMYNE